MSLETLGPTEKGREFSVSKNEPLKKRGKTERVVASAKNIAKKALLATALIAGVKEQMFAKEVAQVTEKKESTEFAESIDGVTSEIKSLEEFADEVYQIYMARNELYNLRELEILKEDAEEQMYLLKKLAKKKDDSAVKATAKEKNALRSCFEAVSSLKRRIEAFSDKSKFKQPTDPKILKEFQYLLDDLNHDLKRMSDMLNAAYG